MVPRTRLNSGETSISAAASHRVVLDARGSRIKPKMKWPTPALVLQFRYPRVRGPCRRSCRGARGRCRSGTLHKRMQVGSEGAAWPTLTRCGGHNGLVSAAYLGRHQPRNGCVLERENPSSEVPLSPRNSSLASVSACSGPSRVTPRPRDDSRSRAPPRNTASTCRSTGRCTRCVPGDGPAKGGGELPYCEHVDNNDPDDARAAHSMRTTPRHTAS